MVMKFLSDNEIITVALNLEDEGYKFYSEAAKISKNKETKDIFNKLKDEEAQHYKTFKELLESLPKGGSRDYFDISEEVASYLNSLIETGVFRSADRVSMKKMSEVMALEIGVDVERDSILFYTKAQESSTNPKGKEILSKIIEIEKEHLVILAKRLRVARKLF